ncbi:tRNA(Ile)-lysidine synthase [Campylobacter majalis]|uniref:tRNA(Ile)-lysidine synthase n=1 Tax=Campylobacter majalis TaxID=2790656 RepID=A0ABN7KCH4_9BACT|nr:tRNA lysidine(34) synthetase TilS [Campylobacter majalis]CAD7289765.1 tRNA(Ile)-lysidine synthase [Campylobacter majalis]
MIICEDELRSGRNLLAFSHGVDSTALFYMLLDCDIAFDVAIVDYNVRKQSKDEVSSAKALCEKFNKSCHVKSVVLDGRNFEANARDVRYEFFKQLCFEYKYTHVIFAHQLNDRLEWLFMQLARGAGLSEMIGMQMIEKRKYFTIVRPLLSLSKDEILTYLQERKIKYFLDESNESAKFTRNKFRLDFATPFLAEFSKGVKKSFEFLQKDKELLMPKFHCVTHDFYIVQNDTNAMRGVDKVCKILGVVMSEAQKSTCLSNCVIGGKIAIGLNADKIYITPYVKTAMSKKFKEKCRLAKIPALNRGYLFSINYAI